MMLQQREQHKMLPAHGWEFVRSDRDELEWWADEIWVLSSVRAPTGFEVYLTFLVDPMFGDDYQGRRGPPKRHPGQAIISVVATRSGPERTVSCECNAFIAGPDWQAALQECFVCLARLRERVSPPLPPVDLAAYREMAEDEEREAEALEWARGDCGRSSR